MSLDSGGDFLSRYRYFRTVLHPRLLLKTRDQLLHAKAVVQNPHGHSSQQVREARIVYESAFHPDTGLVNPVIGRMAFQIPGNVAIVAAMLTFFQKSWQVVGLQLVNQAFMAFCNFTNRNAQSQLTNRQAGSAFAAATVAAVGASVGLRRALADVRSPVAGRLVPFLAVCAGNACNVPLMRQNDIVAGIVVTDREGHPLGVSRKAGLVSVAQVVATRIGTCIPMMVLPPLVMTSLQRRLPLRPPAATAIQASLIGLVTWGALPLACAAFPQRAEMGVARLEGRLRAELQARGGHSVVYFNKGL